MKKLSLALLIVGLLLGPAYWIHAKFYTGEQALLVDLRPQTAKGDGKQTWRTDTFQLRDDMAPVGLILLAEGTFAPNMDESRPPRAFYTATLYKGAQAGQPLGFSLGVKSVADSNPAFKEHLLLMQKVQGGSFHMEVVSQAPPDIQIGQMQVEVRQHIVEPDPRIVMAGILAIVLAILVWVVT